MINICPVFNEFVDNIWQWFFFQNFSKNSIIKYIICVLWHRLDMLLPKLMWFKHFLQYIKYIQSKFKGKIFINLKENSSLVLKLCYFQYLCSKMSKFNSALVFTVLYLIQRKAAHIKIQFSGERVKLLFMCSPIFFEGYYAMYNIASSKICKATFQHIWGSNVVILFQNHSKHYQSQIKLLHILWLSTGLNYIIWLKLLIYVAF